MFLRAALDGIGRDLNITEAPSSTANYEDPSTLSSSVSGAAGDDWHSDDSG